ncbi:uncharacterized protein VTP21DRAFT_3360 [Calcarisporiella thermophila]|uniref:uncharacterized protein n=1 Tax=Calcarisporiella thermophila TaxID=911321 RepID=UPI003743D1B8
MVTAKSSHQGGRCNDVHLSAYYACEPLPIPILPKNIAAAIPYLQHIYVMLEFKQQTQTTLYRLEWGVTWNDQNNTLYFVISKGVTRVTKSTLPPDQSWRDPCRKCPLLVGTKRFECEDIDLWVQQLINQWERDGVPQAMTTDNANAVMEVDQTNDSQEQRKKMYRLITVNCGHFAVWVLHALQLDQILVSRIEMLQLTALWSEKSIYDAKTLLNERTETLRAIEEAPMIALPLVKFVFEELGALLLKRMGKCTQKAIDHLVNTLVLQIQDIVDSMWDTLYSLRSWILPASMTPIKAY